MKQWRYDITSWVSFGVENNLSYRGLYQGQEYVPQSDTGGNRNIEAHIWLVFYNETGAAIGETAYWSPPELRPPDSEDRINGSLAYGFIFDFCGVEVDRTTCRVRVDHYVTSHDAGRILNPVLVDGQIRGGFCHGVGMALFEEFKYSKEGQFLSGSFADYLVPTACEVPDPIIVHSETPSPVTPLGAKGVGEGNSMSTPVCIANAVADALKICLLYTSPSPRD